MLKWFNILSIAIFIIVVSMAPPQLAQGVLKSSDQSEESTFSNSNFEEEIHHHEVQVFYYKPIIFDISYPHLVVLKPQNVIVSVLKPPLV